MTIASQSIRNLVTFSKNVGASARNIFDFKYTILPSVSEAPGNKTFSIEGLDNQKGVTFHPFTTPLIVNSFLKSK